jgi:hypothetical protein
VAVGLGPKPCSEWVDVVTQHSLKLSLGLVLARIVEEAASHLWRVKRIQHEENKLTWSSRVS